MGRNKKKKSGAGRVIWWLVLLIAVAVFCVSGYKLASTMLEYKKRTMSTKSWKKSMLKFPRK